MFSQCGCFHGGREGGPHGAECTRAPPAAATGRDGARNSSSPPGWPRPEPGFTKTPVLHVGAPRLPGAARGLKSLLQRLKDVAAAVVMRGLRRLREGSGRRQVRRAAGGRRVPRVTTEEGGGGAGAGGAGAARGTWVRSEVPGGRRRGRRWRRTAAGRRLRWDLSAFPHLLELGAAVLKPDLYLQGKGRQAVAASAAPSRRLDRPRRGRDAQDSQPRALPALPQRRCRCACTPTPGRRGAMGRPSSHARTRLRGGRQAPARRDVPGTPRRKSLTCVWVRPREAASSALSGRARYWVFWKRRCRAASWKLE